MDRRDFLKSSGAALALPVVTKLVPPESVVPETVKSAGPVVRTCAGTWDGMPTGWARFCNFRLQAPNLHSDGSLTGIGSVPDYYYGHPRDFLEASRLNQEQVAHALGECECGEDDVIAQNDLYWGLDGHELTIEGDGRSEPWTPMLELWPDPVCNCEGEGPCLDEDYDVRDLDNEDWWQNCAHGYHDEGLCECEIGMFMPPGERIDAFELLTPAGRELDRQERLARMKHRHALAEEFRSRAE